MSGFHGLLLSATILLSLGVIHADTIILRSGEKYSDIKATPMGKSHRLQFEDGRVIVIPNTSIRSLRPGKTTWSKVKKPQEKKETATSSNHHELGHVSTAHSAHLDKKDDRNDEQKILKDSKENVTKGDSKENHKDEYKDDSKVDSNKETDTQKTNDPIDLKTRNNTKEWGPLLKSTVLPGWGQYSLGRERTGMIYAIGSVILFQRYYDLRQRHAAAEADYNNPVPVGLVSLQSANGNLSVAEVAGINLVYLSSKEKEVYKLQNQGNNMLLMLGTLWGWNLLDIVYQGLPWDDDGKRRWFAHHNSDRSIRWRVTFQKDTVNLGWSFPL